MAIFIVIQSARDETQKIGILFALFVLLISLLSHTVLEMRSFLCSFSLMAVMSEMSRARYESIQGAIYEEEFEHRIEPALWESPPHK